MNLRSFQSVKERREAIEKEKNVSFKHIGRFSLDEVQASTRNCENMIGAIQVPVGVAGPLKLTTNEYYIPLATTEGALVASVNRGCKAIYESGGASVFVERVGTTRGPVFQTGSLQESHELRAWIGTNIQELSSVATQTSHHLRFLHHETRIIGRLVFVRFAFDTEDAMGMNMVTIATQALCGVIEQKMGVRCLSVSGNFCVDKKPSWQNVILGRGFRAWSEVVLSTTVLTDILKTSVDELFETWEAKCLIGGAATGTMGFNGHAANVIAAIYIATGQDISHVVEGSSAITTMMKVKEGIAVSVELQSVLVGTVGGGTGLATQREALAMLGLAGGDGGRNAEKLAGVIAGAVLAGEISELSALSSHTLACAHQKLGRGK